MAENVSKQKSPVDSVLECPLCLHQLTLPQTLQQCLHSICKSCLDKMPQRTQDGHQGWLCPMCENFSRCDEIQQNTFIEELKKIQADPDVCEKIKCEQCSDNCSPATWKCTDCKIALCESAKITHLKIPMLKGHEVVPLEGDAEKFIDNIVFCKVHAGIPAQLNCYDCEQLICYTCNTTNHKGHSAETVEEALERMLPETESSARQVNENIMITEAQIEGVKKNIEQTKETYASCRMQMDDHLEKVICRMRAMKAQMEEDVNEQESIALDTLQELQKQLENQLSKARIISNLTDVITTKTKHTSQLQQLQTGLFQIVKSASEVKNMRLSFTLPDTYFVEGQHFEEQIDKVFGKLGFDMKQQIIDISGENSTKANQFLCSDFNKLTQIKYKKAREISVDTSWCFHISYIGNKILLPLDSRNKINIYDEDGELENVIDTGDKSITVVKEAHNGDIICAGDSGLYVTDTQLSTWTKLTGGEFCDVVVDTDKFIALHYGDPSVHTYSQRPVNDGQRSSWHESHSFLLGEDVPVDYDSIICIVAKQYLFISTKSEEGNGLFKLTCDGEYLDKNKDVPLYPVICGIDKSYQVLVADFMNGAMHLLKPVSEKGVQMTAIQCAVKTPQISSVIIDKNYNFWVLTGSVHTFKLIKFASEL